MLSSNLKSYCPEDVAKTLLTRPDGFITLNLGTWNNVSCFATILRNHREVSFKGLDLTAISPHLVHELKIAESENEQMRDLRALPKLIQENLPHFDLTRLHLQFAHSAQLIVEVDIYGAFAHVMPRLDTLKHFSERFKSDYDRHLIEFVYSIGQDGVVDLARRQPGVLVGNIFGNLFLV